MKHFPNKLRAKKSLGQHFLKSERALSTIVESAKIQEGDTILEIGPGMGALTEKLLAAGCQLIAVEKDDKLFVFLKNKFKEEIDEGKLTLVHDDILNFNPESYNLKARSYKLVANIPYNITGAVFKKFLEEETQPETMVLLVQKEVADRVVAKDGKESILSISVKAYGTPKYIETVKAGSFAPAPKVDSAILVVDDISKQFFTTSANQLTEKDFFTILRAGFKSKRKKLSSNLSTIFKKETVKSVFNDLRLDENLRAEDVEVEKWKILSSKLTQTEKRG